MGRVECTGPDCALCRLVGPPTKTVFVPLVDPETGIPNGQVMQITEDKARELGVLPKEDTNG